MKEKHVELLRANSDVVMLVEITKKIGWQSVKEQSIQRLFYLSSILNSFISPDVRNDFDDYRFSITKNGPYCSLISASIINLKTREMLIEVGDALVLNGQLVQKLQIDNEAKKKWFEVVVYLIGLYGENKIYAFVIRDPEYKNAFLRNSVQDLRTDDQSKTIEFLNEFREAFEETLSDVSSVSNVEYLELYFQYVFSKIIKND